MPLFLLLAPSRPSRRAAPEPAASGPPTGSVVTPPARAEESDIGRAASLRTGADRVLFNLTSGPTASADGAASCNGTGPGLL
jgi:hypothetical protein